MGKLAFSDIQMVEKAISSYHNENNISDFKMNNNNKMSENDILASSNISACGNLEKMSQYIQNSLNMN